MAKMFHFLRISVWVQIFVHLSTLLSPFATFRLDMVGFFLVYASLRTHGLEKLLWVGSVLVTI